MRRALTLALLALGLLQASDARAARLVWTGAGRTGNASEPANWSAWRVPGPGDSVVLGPSSSRDCYWDYEAEVAELTLTEKFLGDLRFAAPVRIKGNLTVLGGMIYLRGQPVTVGRRLYVARAGIFELADGELKVGRQGIEVERGGSFFSRGELPARIGPARPGEYFPFSVDRGNLEISNPAGTTLEGSGGLALGRGTNVRRADYVEVRNLKPGAPALRLARGSGAVAPAGWTFDGTVRTRVSAGDRRQGLQALKSMARPRPALPPAPAPEAEAADEPAPPPAAAEAAQDEPFSGFEAYESALARAQLQPFLSVRFSGGQHFFAGQEGNLSGNLNVLASLSVKGGRLGDRWTLVPVLASQYQGTKQVTDLVGGGTLFQERMSHSLAFRSVYQLDGRWKLKPSLGYKWELLKETRDEAWGEGLFDYRRPGFSVEAECAYREPFSYSLGYDFYHIGFVNFVSLESVIQDSQGNSLARELAGDKVLDSYNHAFNFRGSVEGPRDTYFEADAVTTLRFFPEQHVVGASGDYRSATRRDLAFSLGGAWRAPRRLTQEWKAVGGLRAGAGGSVSNQNSYDAQRLKYLENYYDSFSLRGGLDLSFSRALAARQGWSGPRSLDLGLSLTLGRINYLGREAQAASGLYGGDKIYQNEIVLNAGVSYPVAPHFVWTAQFGWGRQTSNQAFEKLYRYNFSTTNYRFGFGYEF